MRRGILILCLYLSISLVHAASVRLSPEEGTFIKDCPFTVEVFLDIQEMPVQTAEIKLHTDGGYRLSFSPLGGIFPSYVPPRLGKVRHGEHVGGQAWYILGSTMGGGYVQGSGLFGTLTITPHSGQDTLNLQFYALPGQLYDDSNVVYMQEDGVMIDILTDIQGGSYTFKDGDCPNIHHVALEEPEITPFTNDILTLSLSNTGDNAMVPFDITFMKYAYYMKLALAYTRSFTEWYTYLLHGGYFLSLN